MMIWLAVYTKLDSSGKLILRQIGNFYGGNCQEVIKKVCKIHSIRPPKNSKDACSVKIEVELPDHPGMFEVHSITVGPMDCLIEVS